MIGIGIGLYLKPTLIWKLTEQWKSSYADEPSEFYLKSTKFGGILFIIAGLVISVLPLILE